MRSIYQQTHGPRTVRDITAQRQIFLYPRETVAKREATQSAIDIG